MDQKKKKKMNKILEEKIRENREEDEDEDRETEVSEDRDVGLLLIVFTGKTQEVLQEEIFRG